MARPILLSFTATLNAVARKELSEEDLAHAIFFYRCTKGWTCVSDVSEVLLLQRHDHEMDAGVTTDIIRLVRRHAINATMDGRAAWRKQDDHTPMPVDVAVRTINQMLRKANLSELPEGAMPEYTYSNSFFGKEVERANTTDGDVLVAAFY